MKDTPEARTNFPCNGAGTVNSPSASIFISSSGSSLVASKLNWVYSVRYELLRDEYELIGMKALIPINKLIVGFYINTCLHYNYYHGVLGSNEDLLWVQSKCKW
ncbi:hypothetical protein M0R45_032009 [Rubus argutus]|uniref:Uncharacterized protein n=1 Tax=Rubus argutus TaxID=59490 RepID=A0AAW1WFA1_RUBAR